jgi:hypothetical protein
MNDDEAWRVRLRHGHAESHRRSVLWNNSPDLQCRIRVCLAPAHSLLKTVEARSVRPRVEQTLRLRSLVVDGSRCQRVEPEVSDDVDDEVCGLRHEHARIAVGWKKVYLGPEAGLGHHSDGPRRPRTEVEVRRQWRRATSVNDTDVTRKDAQVTLGVRFDGCDRRYSASCRPHTSASSETKWAESRVRTCARGQGGAPSFVGLPRVRLRVGG